MTNHIDAFRAPVAKVTFKPVDRPYSRRSVFGSHIETAHVWASNNVFNGRSSDDRMSFNGGVLYSYGTHFALGIVLETTDGRVTLLNDDSYSVSTSKHKSHARHAAHGTTYYVPNLTNICEALQDLAAGSKDSWRLSYIRAYIEERILTAPVDVLRFLAGCLGLKAGNLCVIYRKRVAKESAAAAKAAATDKAVRMNRAKFAAAMSESDFQAWIAAQLEKARYIHKERRHENAGEILKRVASELRKLHKDAKAWLGVRATATLKARLDTVTKDSKRLLKHATATAELAEFSRYKETFRKYLAIAEKGMTQSYDKAAAETLARLATYFAQRKHCGAVLAGKLAEIVRAANARREELAAIEAAERMAKERAGREAWLAGDSSPEYRYARYSDEMGRALLRIKGNTLETSHGASVPLDDAIKVLKFVKLVRTRGEGWKRNGATLPVGHFQVDAIDATGNFVAGCHKISWNEVSRVAGLIGLADITPADTTQHG